jgi:ATP-binding protein involved in chromosome partitioning
MCPTFDSVNMRTPTVLADFGVIENMSCFKCPHCGEPSYIFGKGGAHSTAAEMGLEFLGEVC